MLTHRFLLDNFHYDPETGIWTRLNTLSSRAKRGIIGSPQNMGYLKVTIFGKSYLLHRLAWFYIYGLWPLLGIDHINGIKTDNRLCNLREASQAQNMANRGAQVNSKSRHKGVWWDSTNKKWKSQITVNRQCLNVGTFDTLEEAIDAQRLAAIKHHGIYAKAA